jgi:DNA-binding response OmpR family regulator
MNSSASILVVDGDPLTLTGLAAALHLSGYTIQCAADEEAAEKAAKKEAFDLIICDGDRLKQPTWPWLNHLRDFPLQQESPCICLVHHADMVLLAQVGDAYWATAVTKPYDPKSLLEVVENTLWMPHLVNVRSQQSFARQS